MDINVAIETCLKEISLVKPRNTTRSYHNGLGRFRDFLRQEKIETTEQVSVDVFIRYYTWLAKREYAKQTTTVYISAVKHFVDWLIMHRHLQPDQADQLRLKQAPALLQSKRGDYIPRIPAKGDADKVHLASRQLPLVRDRAIIAFLYSSGCRRFELARLKVNSIDLDEKSGTVIGKNSERRPVFFSQEAADLIRMYFSERGVVKSNDPVFCQHRRGGKISSTALGDQSIYNVVLEACRLAGVSPHGFTPHSFRHDFAIRILRETGNVALAQDLLGHKSGDVTRIYATIYPEELRDAHHKIFK